MSIGKTLCEEVIERARRLGYKRMLLDTAESLSRANSLYRKLGFRRTEPYCYNPIHDAIFMELDLN